MSIDDYISSNKKRYTTGQIPKNYTWKELFKIMINIKKLWRVKMFNDNSLSLDAQSLSKFMYNNLKNCFVTIKIRNKNELLLNKGNSFFQKMLFDYLIDEQELYNEYDDLFKMEKYIPKLDVDNKSLFSNFIINYKDIYYSIEKEKKSMKHLKKIRWYLFMDKDNLYTDSIQNENKILDIISLNSILESTIDNLDSDDSFNDEEKKKIYDDFILKEKENSEDFLDEIFEKNIINDKFLEKFIKNEKNPLIYIIKLLFISIKTFAISCMCHLLNTFLYQEENDDGKILINEYIIYFNNFVESCLAINNKCSNINISMNYLYNSIYGNHPKFPKFSIFRMCIRIWFAEANTHLIGDKTLFNEIKDKICSIFSNNLDENLLSKIKGIASSEKNYFNSMNYFNKLNLNNSIMKINFENDYKKNYLNNHFSTCTIGNNFVNKYNDSDRQFTTLIKGLSIINDTFSDEFSVYIQNLTSIKTNNLYSEILNSFQDSIKNCFNNIFNELDMEINCDMSTSIDDILNYFNRDFFKEVIIVKLRNDIYNYIYSTLRDYLFNYSKNKYLKKVNKANDSYGISINNIESSAKTAYSSQAHLSLNSSSILDLNNDINHSNESDYKNDIISYIKKNFYNNCHQNEIEKILDNIDKETKIYEAIQTVYSWYINNMNLIKINENKVKEELNKTINIPLYFNHYKRRLISYSMQYDWEFIKKVKNLDNYRDNINEDVDMIDNNNDIDIDDLGQNYLDDFDNN